MFQTCNRPGANFFSSRSLWNFPVAVDSLLRPHATAKLHIRLALATRVTAALGKGEFRQKWFVLIAKNLPVFKSDNWNISKQVTVISRSPNFLGDSVWRAASNFPRDTSEMATPFPLDVVPSPQATLSNIISSRIPGFKIPRRWSRPWNAVLVLF